MPSQPSPRPASVLASVVAAGLMLTAASGSHLTPLGRDAGPRPHHLRSLIVVAGAEDDRFDDIAATLPDATYMTVPGDHFGALMSPEFRAAAIG